MWKKLAFVALLASASCGVVKDNGISENLIGVISECVETDTTLCLKEKALKFTERMAISKNLDIFEGISLVNTGSARSARSYEPLPEEPKARELQIEDRIADNVADFLENHVLQLRLSEPIKESRALGDEARGKKKLKKLFPLALVPVFLAIIAIVSVKALILGKIAFAMQAMTILRKLFAKGGHSSGHSAHHHHHAEHPGYNYEPAQTGWNRQATDASLLAYGQ